MSMFTKRHYVWLASVARDMIPTYNTTDEIKFGANQAIFILADALEAESSGFDKLEFLINVYANPLET